MLCARHCPEPLRSDSPLHQQVGPAESIPGNSFLRSSPAQHAPHPGFSRSPRPLPPAYKVTSAGNTSPGAAPTPANLLQVDTAGRCPGGDPSMKTCFPQAYPPPLRVTVPATPGRRRRGCRFDSAPELRPSSHRLLTSTAPQVPASPEPGRLSTPSPGPPRGTSECHPTRPPENLGLRLEHTPSSPPPCSSVSGFSVLRCHLPLLWDGCPPAAPSVHSSPQAARQKLLPTHPPKHSQPKDRLASLPLGTALWLQQRVRAGREEEPPPTSRTPTRQCPRCRAPPGTLPEARVTAR